MTEVRSASVLTYVRTDVLVFHSGIRQEKTTTRVRRTSEGVVDPGGVGRTRGSTRVVTIEEKTNKSWTSDYLTIVNRKPQTYGDNRTGRNSPKKSYGCELND